MAKRDSQFPIMGPRAGRSHIPEVDNKLFHPIPDCANCYIHAKCSKQQPAGCRKYRPLREPAVV